VEKQNKKLKKLNKPLQYDVSSSFSGEKLTFESTSTLPFLKNSLIIAFASKELILVNKNKILWKFYLV
jgi:hypothetical protein